MNPMMMMAAAAAGLLFLMQRGQAAPAAQDKERAQAQAQQASAPATQVVAPFETAGDDARDVRDLGPTTPGSGQQIVVQQGDRKTVTQRVDPLIKTTDVAPAARRGPQIVPMTSQPSIR
jgi:hypothetical protein